MSVAVLGVGGAIAAGVAVAGVGVEAYSASQASGVAGTQASLAKSQLGMEQTQFGEQQGYASQLQQLMANPSSITSTPGYQFQFNQGAGATARSAAATGFNMSGNEGAALTQYGQQFAQSAYGQQVQLLQGLAGFNAPAYGSNSSSAANAATGANINATNQAGNSLASLSWLSGRLGGGNTSSLWGLGGGGSSGGGAPSIMTTDFSTGSLFGGAGFSGTGFSAGATQ